MDGQPAAACLQPSDLIDDHELSTVDEDRLAHEGIADQLAALVRTVKAPSNIALYGPPFIPPTCETPSGGSDQPPCDAAALAEVVVIGPRAIPLDVGTRGLRRAAVELHPAMHPDHRLHDVRRQPTDP